MTRSLNPHLYSPLCRARPHSSVLPRAPGQGRHSGLSPEAEEAPDVPRTLRHRKQLVYDLPEDDTPGQGRIQITSGTVLRVLVLFGVSFSYSPDLQWSGSPSKSELPFPPAVTYSLVQQMSPVSPIPVEDQGLQ